jgi:hypothetical protein
LKILISLILILLYWYVQFVWVADYLYINFPKSLIIFGALGLIILIFCFFIKNNHLTKFLIPLSIIIITTCTFNYAKGSCFIDNECKYFEILFKKEDFNKS